MQYDTPNTAADVTDVLEQNQGVSNETLAAIQSILGLDNAETNVNVGVWNGSGDVTVPTGNGAPELLMVELPGAAGENITLDIPDHILAGTSVYVLSSDANITATFNTVERVIVSGNGHDFLTVNGDRNTTLDGADGDDTLTTTGGDDSVTGGAGSDSISTGEGNDTIVFSTGEDTVEGINGSDTIDAGEGYDVVEVAANYADVTLAVDEDGHLVITTSAGTADLLNAEFIQLADQSVAVTTTAADAAALKLYEGILGRSGDASGAEYWLSDVDNGQATVELARSFLNSDEFTSANSDLTDDQFVDLLYTNALGWSAEADTGSQYWVDALAGGEDRAAVAVAIIGSDDAASNINSVILIDGQV